MAETAGVQSPLFFVITFLFFVKNLTCGGVFRPWLAIHPPCGSKQCLCSLTNHNLCDIFYALKEIFIYKFMFLFYQIWDITCFLRK